MCFIVKFPVKQTHLKLFMLSRNILLIVSSILQQHFLYEVAA